MKYLFLLLLVAASIGTFMGIINPQYQQAKALRTEVLSSDTRLETAQKLKNSRQELIERYNSIPKKDLENLKTLLPDSVDNIRLIIVVDSLATKNGLSFLRNVQYETNKVEAPAKPGAPAQNPYGEFTISFDTMGPYSNFLSFISDLEQNLRLVDVTAIKFTEDATATTKSSAPTLKYSVTLKTYWLKK